MSLDKKSSSSENKNISIGGDVVDSAVFIGDNNTVNQTIIQKFFNIFKSDSETLEHRNRRILLGHVENAWIKGVLDASLHGAALLDLGIKQDPEAVTKYPWAIKKESTDETLPAGTSMLEIFDSIGMGRSLLILGAPGSGKTTMLLELARGLIARAREDVTYPIPMVFNLASWTEKLSLSDWLAQELNNLYSVPRKTAPDWVKGDKLLLLLDGLDEVRQESRAKCVEAINAFRKAHGLTSLAVCSRSQDYADLNAKLSFEGAIEVQPLTQKQITEFFNRFGDEMAGIKQVLEKDSALREMAETPLFLSIMLMAYRDKRDVEILISGDEKERRKHLFDAYIERMFERRTNKTLFTEQDVLHWLSWLAGKMVKHNAVPYLIEDTQPAWFDGAKQVLRYKFLCGIISGLIVGLTFELIGVMTAKLTIGIIVGLVFGLFFGLSSMSEKISTFDSISWNWSNVKNKLSVALKIGLITGLITVLIFGLFLLDWSVAEINISLSGALFIGLCLGLFMGLSGMMFVGLNIQHLDQATYPGQRLVVTAKNFFFIFLVVIGSTLGLLGGLIGLLMGPEYILPVETSLFGIIVIESFMGLRFLLFVGLSVGLIFGLRFGGVALIQHFILRLILARNNLLPWRLVPFLDHCVDLIFLRRVGGGYIFVHRLLMEHFAEMYVETPTSKGNQK